MLQTTGFSWLCLLGFALGAVSYYSATAAANVPILSAQMRKQVWKDLGHWAQMVGFIKKTQNVEVGVPGNDLLPRPTGMPIEVMKDFVSEGREDMIIPMKRILTGAPVGGDSQMEGTEERYKVSYKRVTINALGHAVNVVSGPMSKQRFHKYALDLFKRGKADLTDWFSRYYASFLIQLAIFEGRSHNLTAGLEGYLGMKSVARRSHPNFFVAGSGQIAFANGAYTSLPGTAGYETAVAAALNGLAPGATTVMSTKALKLMKAEAIRKRIPQTITKEGIKFYPVVMHTSQSWQLKQDTDWKADARHALPRGWSNPIFTGAIGFYDGMVIYEQDDMFGVQWDGDNVITDASGRVRYGPAITQATENIFAEHSTPIKLAVLYGPSFLGIGIAQDIRLADELKDYDRQTNAGADAIIGAERCDYYDEDGYGGTAGDFHENTSSVILATWSEHNFSWT
jgi:hypothetical protein